MSNDELNSYKKQVYDFYKDFLDKIMELKSPIDFHANLEAINNLSFKKLLDGLFLQDEKSCLKDAKKLMKASNDVYENRKEYYNRKLQEYLTKGE